jgi:hypothetical protein
MREEEGKEGDGVNMVEVQWIHIRKYHDETQYFVQLKEFSKYGCSFFKKQPLCFPLLQHQPSVAFISSPPANPNFAPLNFNCP